MTQQAEPEIGASYGISAVARFLGCSRQNAWRMIAREGMIPAFRIGPSNRAGWRVTGRSLREYMGLPVPDTSADRAGIP